MAIVDNSRGAKVGATARYSALILAALLFLLPFYLLLRNALMSENDLGSPKWHWLPPTRVCS